MVRRVQQSRIQTPKYEQPVAGLRPSCREGAPQLYEVGSATVITNDAGAVWIGTNPRLYQVRTFGERYTAA
jgi:hypothetical protein